LLSSVLLKQSYPRWKTREEERKPEGDASFLKGSVSRVLRWVLLYIIQKLFSRPIIALHKILTFLKGQFTIYIKQAGADNIESRGKYGLRNIEIRNSPSE